MNIVRYRQWPGQLQEEIRQVFDRCLQAGDPDESVAASQWAPRVDIKEEAARFVIYADVPGIDPQQIRVQADKGVLSIRGERRSEGSADSERFSRVERRHGSFHRRFTLPETADPEGVTAVLDDATAKSVARYLRHADIKTVELRGGEVFIEYGDA